MPDLLPNPPAPSDAFLLALSESQTALRGYCEASLGPGEDAKDAWQRTNLVLWKKSASWDPSTPFLRWALAVARYEVLAVVRDRSRERLVFDPDVVELMAAEADPIARDSTARQQALRHCLERLSDRARRLVESHYLHDHPQDAAARQLGMKPGAARVALLRARRFLAECIERRLPTLS